MLKPALLFIATTFVTASCFTQDRTDPLSHPDSLNGHKVVLDSSSRILSWYTPRSEAYHQFLTARWNFIKTGVPMSPPPAPRSDFPQYYFYCAYRPADGELVPDTWMNDIGERLPNWFESARLYYAYSGDSSVMRIVTDLAEYILEHGTSPATFAWPHFPYTTTDAGETEFTGFTSAKRFVKHEVQVDHAGDMGLTYYRLYLYNGNKKFRDAAIGVANTLAAHARTGTAEKSVWPYRVVMDSGRVTAEYGANWTGCYELLRSLAGANLGNVSQYRAALEKARLFVLRFPVRTGYWTDGHTDTDINSNTYKSNMSASNTTLYMLDHPDFDPQSRLHIPALISWTEKYFVNRSAPGEPGNQWGANIVGEQDSFMYKMDYQTARYAAECARWYALSGDESYKDKAFRSLNWVTYCNDGSGMAFESPLSKGISSWWSDCYGEGPRMFYHAFAAVPEWAPPEQNHILYSAGVLKEVQYEAVMVQYSATDAKGTDFLRLAFKPRSVMLNGKRLTLSATAGAEGYTLKNISGNDYALTITRSRAGVVLISGK